MHTNYCLVIVDVLSATAGLCSTSLQRCSLMDTSEVFSMAPSMSLHLEIVCIRQVFCLIDNSAMNTPQINCAVHGRFSALVKFISSAESSTA